MLYTLDYEEDIHNDMVVLSVPFIDPIPFIYH